MKDILSLIRKACRNTLVLAAVIMPVSAQAQTSIKEALQRQMRNYPESQLCDVYKNFFQDNFGPGHMLNDTAAAGRGLRRELESTERFDGPLYEPTGYKANFYRVNLSLIKDGVVDYDKYFDAFVRSVQGIVPPESDVWRAEWNEIDSEIGNLGLTFPEEAADRAMIAERLASGDFAVHHSQRYNDNYEFHYRIISREIFLAEILPLIQAR